MERTRFLIIGAGVSGLAFARWLADSDWLVLEQSDAIGGFCKTVVKDGFVWDYSGHFFHFKHKDIERFLVERMAGQRVLTVKKVSYIRTDDRLIDFPFQKNIHQLPLDEFLECLHDLWFRGEHGPITDFKAMLYAKLGRGIAERFLIPYNEKLYATDLATLDPDAMGRFFPHAEIGDIIKNFRHPDNASYNATFTYPEGGAIQYVDALAKDLDPARIRTGEGVVAIDLKRKIATTTRGRAIAFEHVVSSAPFPRLLQMTGLPHDPAIYTANKVLVFNLGFDKKGSGDAHWIYFAARDLVFYRVGFYDNIFGHPRMSLYVEIGLPAEARPTDADVEAYRARVLVDLERVGIIDGHQLVAEHSVILDPAYVHITKASLTDVAQKRATLALAGVHSIGRYGGWTYCAIEDNIVEARALADRFNTIG
ncbi:MAG: FAD-dependent oxidoreductase [Deltaproteobacteria bacterium]|nr:FAD-dependent oxidoreductase [Deltaproteobacteria bacterium]